MLERRVSLLGVLSAALDERDVYVRIGGENPQPALQSLSLVAANYGLPQRNLGTVSVIGPTRMDYATRDPLRARGGATSCRASSRTLYESRHAARLLRGPRRVERDADDAEIKKAFRRLARELHPDVNAHDPEAEEKFKEAAEAYEVLSDAERRQHLRRLRPRGPARPAATRPTSRASARSRTCSGVLRRRRVRRGVRRHAAARRRRCRAATWRVAVAIDLGEAAHGTLGRGHLRARRRCARPATATAPSPARRSSRARAARAPASSRPSRARASARWCAPALCDVCGGDGRVARAAVPHAATAAGMIGRASAPCRSTSRPGIADGQRIRVTGRGHAGERGGPGGRPLRRRARARGRALPARRRGPRDGGRRRGAARRARHDDRRADARRRRCRWRSRPARSRARRS